MRKITFYFYVLCCFVFSWQAHAQSTCAQVFSESGYDDSPTVITINPSDLNCNGGQPIQQVLLSDFSGLYYGSDYCGDYYDFGLEVTGGTADGTLISNGCDSDFIGLDVTGFTTITFTSNDIDAYSDYISMTIDVEVTYETPSCLEPLDMTATAVTDTTANLEWSASESGETAWNLEWNAGADFTPGMGEESGSDSVSGSPVYNAIDLLPDTTYYVYYQADCGGGDTSSWAGPFVGTTLCEPFLPDYTENFDSFLPDCWNEADSGDPAAGPSSLGTGSWTSDGWLNSGSTGAAKINIYYNVKSDWLLTPGFDLTSGGYELNFKVAFTTWGGTDEGTFDPEDEVQLLYTVDGMTWVNLETWNTSNTPSNTGDVVTIDISGVTDSFVQFAFWAKEDPSGSTSTDNDFFIDDFTVRTPLTCTYAEVDSSTISADCDNSQFYVDIDILTVGDGTQVSDGTNTYAISGVGILQVGPFSSGESVDLSVEHSDGACDFELGTFEYICPPSNDLPSAAIALTLDEGEACGENIITDITNLAATDSGEGAATCGSYNGGDLWYTIVAPAEIITLNVSNVTGLTSVAGAIYSGTPGGFTELDCTAFSSGWPWEISGLTIGETYYLQVFDYGNDEEGTFDLCGYYISCTPAEVIAGVVPNCDSEEFFVEIGIDTVEDFGDLVTLTDGEGQSETVNTSQQLYIFGPYPNGTEVTILAEHSNPACDFEVGTWEFYCPPANDDCPNAIVLAQETNIVDADSATPTPGTLEGATDSGLPSESCNGWTGNANDDVWYSFEALTESATITIDNTTVDIVIQAYSGTCGGFSNIGCSDSGNPEEIELESLNIGETYYFRVYQYGTGSTIGDNFDVKVWSTMTLSVNHYDNISFQYYPNPVENSLTIKAQQAIELVEVYNMLGQMVANETPNNMEGTIDMSTLTAGAYFVKVTFGNSSETIRIVKK